MVLLGAFILLILSIIVLIGTSHLVIDSAMKISHITKIGEFVIGFIFIALATSLPELAVSFSAISLGDVGLSIGNLLGSNVTDIALLLGIFAIMSPLVVKRETVHRLSIILFVTSLIPLSLLFIRGSTQIVGAVLIVFFFVFIYYSNKKKFRIHKKVKKPVKLKEVFPFIVLFLVGIFGLLVSSNYVVESAVEISKILGIAGSVVGATIIAVGTSLPELVIGIEAVRLGHWRLAMGEVIGSTLTNISLVLGFVLLTAPFVINMDIFTTMIMFVLLTNIVLFYFLVVRTKGKLERKEGMVLLFIYILFLMSLFATQIIII